MTLEVWERAEAADATGVGPDAAGRPASTSGTARRRLWWALAVAAAVALVAGAIWLAYARAAHRGTPLDPDNAGPEGSRAVARVLDQRGVDVTIARRQDVLLAAEVSSDTTVVVTSTFQLSDATAGNLLRHSLPARRLVLVRPDAFVLDALDLPVTAATQADTGAPLRAGCSLAGLDPGDTIVSGAAAYTTVERTATRCFTRTGAAAVVALPATHSRPEVVVVGSTDLLRNDAVTRFDHAGVGLRLLGRGDSLVWYVPSYLDFDVADQTGGSAAPDALWPLVGLALCALLVLMVWRGRRFGPLVHEPLPAVVKAIETTQSRGRLYRKAGDTARAGAALRARTLRRLAQRLGLPPGAEPAAVADAVTAATGLDPHRVHRVLAGPPPADEPALVALNHDLSQLEKEVRRA